MQQELLLAILVLVEPILALVEPERSLELL